MSDAFQPGPAALVAHGGKFSRAPYNGTTAEQHRQSIALMVEKIREGRFDHRLSGRAGKVLRDAGLDGRSLRSTIRRQTEAILDHVRKETVYTPDAVGAEVIQGAAATLCIEPGLCLRHGDCDDMVVLLIVLLLCVGISCQIVKEDYGDGIQSHVLVGVRDENGEWFFADPSTNGPLETHRDCKNREWTDPMEGAPVEIVGIGSPHRHRSGDSRIGLGATTPAVGIQLPGTWVNVPGNNVVAGLRYAVAIIGVPTSGWTEADVTAYFSPPGTVANMGVMSISSTVTAGPQFLVEQVIQGASVSQSWVMIGIARTDGVVPTNQNSTLPTTVAVLQEQPPATSAPVGPSTLATPPPPIVNAIGAGEALLWGLGLAAVGGLAWELYRKGYFK
jgi:hypothetical protein